MPQDLPTKNDYQQILQHPNVYLNPDIYLTDPRLKDCHIEMDPMGFPRVRSGGFALTYQLENGNTRWALRCFHKVAAEREHRYQAICRFIKSNPSSILLKVDYLAQGIRVKGNLYPITIMEWAEGDTLGTYIFKNINNSGKITKLPEQFLFLVEELERIKIAHGDLSNQNIIINNGKMILVDYDGMYVPELHGQNSTELGNPNFQHAGRNETHFGPTLDRFSEIVIYLGLKALSLSPDLYQKYGQGGEGLLFGRDDLQNPYNSKVIKQLETISELKPLVERFRTLCQGNISNIPGLKNFIQGQPIEIRKADEINSQTRYVTNYQIIDASQVGALLENEDEMVTVIGKISTVRKSNTRYGNPYAFLNVGIWPNQTFTVVLWSETLTLLEGVGKSPMDFEGKWISVSGVIGTYLGKPQTILESPADIAVISEEEARKRIKGNNTQKETSVGCVSNQGKQIETKPTIVEPHPFAGNPKPLNTQIQTLNNTTEKAAPPAPPPISHPPAFNPNSPSNNNSSSNIQGAKKQVDISSQLNRLYSSAGQTQVQSPASTPKQSTPQTQSANQTVPQNSSKGSNSQTGPEKQTNRFHTWEEVAEWFKKHFKG